MLVFERVVWTIIIIIYKFVLTRFKVIMPAYMYKPYTYETWSRKIDHDLSQPFSNFLMVHGRFLGLYSVVTYTKGFLD